MSEKPMSCVLLADRHHGLAESVRGLLESFFETVVMVADETSLLEGAGRLHPDMAVVDLSLAKDAGLSWLRELRVRSPELKIIVISIHDGQSVRRGGDGSRCGRFRAQKRHRDRPECRCRTRPRSAWQRELKTTNCGNLKMEAIT